MNSEEHRRIYGLETEYGLIYSKDNRPEDDSTLQAYPILPEKIENWFLKVLAATCAVRYNRSHYDEERKVMMDIFTLNGGRIYLDCGQHPETSTPECDSLRQVVLYDKAAERILEEALKKPTAASNEKKGAKQKTITLSGSSKITVTTRKPTAVTKII